MPDPNPKDGLSPSVELPGDFVSEELRADCDRFLKDLHALIALRAGEPRDGFAEE